MGLQISEKPYCLFFFISTFSYGCCWCEVVVFAHRAHVVNEKELSLRQEVNCDDVVADFDYYLLIRYI